MDPVGFFLRSPSGENNPPIEMPDLETVFEIRVGRRLVCRVCGEPITAEALQLSVGGRSVHCRTNPAGVEFEFGCFERAPGAIVVGNPTTDFSWFAGYAWSFSHCRNCGQHLGWFFQGKDPRFHGLILNRLTAEESAPER